MQNQQSPDKFRKRGREISRIEAFSDVVFGFSLTLLLVSSEVPQSFQQLLADVRGFLPFAACFAIFAYVWWLHHDFFRRYGLDDGVTIVLNFLLLFVILFYTYPLKFVFVELFNQVVGHQNYAAPGVPSALMQQRQGSTVLIIFGLGYGMVFVIFDLLYWNALRQKDQLELTPSEVFETHTSILQCSFLLAIGVLSAALAALLPPNWAGWRDSATFLFRSAWRDSGHGAGGPLGTKGENANAYCSRSSSRSAK